MVGVEVAGHTIADTGNSNVTTLFRGQSRMVASVTTGSGAISGATPACPAHGRRQSSRSRSRSTPSLSGGRSARVRIPLVRFSALVEGSIGRCVFPGQARDAGRSAGLDPRRVPYALPFRLAGRFTDGLRNLQQGESDRSKPLSEGVGLSVGCEHARSLRPVDDFVLVHQCRLGIVGLLRPRVPRNQFGSARRAVGDARIACSRRPPQ